MRNGTVLRDIIKRDLISFVGLSIFLLVEINLSAKNRKVYDKKGGKGGNMGRGKRKKEKKNRIFEINLGIIR